MMVKAKAKYLRIAPRKARLLVDAIRGLDVGEAMNRLALMNKKSVDFVSKVLASAIANAENNNQIDRKNLFIKDISVNSGPTFYRWMPKAHGRATPIRKRTSVIEVVVSEKVEMKTVKKSKKSEKIEAPEILEKKISDEIDEKVSVPKKATAKKNEKDDVREQPFVSQRKGGFRDTKQQPINNRKEKGAFKKMFTRKTGV